MTIFTWLVYVLAFVGVVSLFVFTRYKYEKWLWNDGKCRCGGTYRFEELVEEMGDAKVRLYRCDRCVKLIKIKFLVDL